MVNPAPTAALGSAPLPLVTSDDHARGPEDGRVVVVYADFECPFCAMVEARLATLPLRTVFRHFPVAASHPRAQAAAYAAEAAAREGAFWPMHDSLYADQSRLEDPHLWARVEQLGLDVTRFEAIRRSPEVAERVRRDFRAGVRAGVVTTPTLFLDGVRHAGRPSEALWTELAA